MKKLSTAAILLISLAPFAYLALIWSRLPAQVAMHFNLQGNADRYGSKRELIGTCVLLLAVNLFVYFLLTNIHRIDPKKYAASNQLRMRNIATALIVFMSALSCLIIYSSAKGSISFGTQLILGAVGLLLAVIGNYMPNLKPNYFAGIRLPWTLENEENWRKTHQLAGKLWFAGGLLITITCPFLPPAASFTVFMIIIAAMVLIPCIHSFQLYRAQNL